MAKIVDGSIVLDPNDYIDFKDNQRVSHRIYWDDVLDRFLTNEEFQAEQFINTTNAAVFNRPPQPSDSDYVVPTLWIDSTTQKPYLLVSVDQGNAIWSEVGGGEGSIDHSITINDGIAPTEFEPFDMWITIEPE